jgi:hypothetical protein
VFRTFPQKDAMDEHAADAVFVLADSSGELLAAKRGYWETRSYSPEPDFELNALPDRDIDGDGVNDIALTTSSGSAHGEWSSVVVYTSARPQLVKATFYGWAGESSAQGHDWRYSCATTIADRFALLVYKREQEWDDEENEKSTSAVYLFGERPEGADKAPLYAVQIAEHNMRKQLVPAWREAVGTTNAKPWGWPADHAKLYEMATCPGDGAPLIVHKGAIKKSSGARYKLLRDVSWDLDAAKKAAKSAGGTLVELRK